MVVLLELFSSARCSYTFTRGCALDIAGDIFPDILQILMLSFAANDYILDFQESKMLLGCSGTE